MMSGKKLFISEFQEGQRIRDLFLVARKHLAETKAGKPYLALTLMDKSGEIEARVWDNAVQLDALAAVGAVLVVQAQAKSYQNQLQLGVSQLQRAEAAQVELADFMPSSKRSLSGMREELGEVLASLQDPGLGQLLGKLFSGELLEQFCTAPAAKKMHHAYIGGLLEHTLSVVGLAEKASCHYPGLDRDMLMAGALVHDIAKTREFSYSSVPFDYTDCGRLVGHLVLGAEMVRTAASGLDDLAPERVDQLVHLVLSHHGRHEFGAPVLPMTPEAILLHHLDDIDAKMNYIDRLREKQDEPGWSDYQRPLERFLYLHPQEEGLEPPGFSPLTPSGSDQGSEAKQRAKARKTQADLRQRQQSLF